MSTLDGIIIYFLVNLYPSRHKKSPDILQNVKDRREYWAKVLSTEMLLKFHSFENELIILCSSLSYIEMIM